MTNAHRAQPSYIPTGTILDQILERKVTEVNDQKTFIALSEITSYVERELADDPVRDFVAALHRPNDEVALIAEVKKASPSKGVLIENFDPVAIAETYSTNGAAAISVLTDKPFFQGDLKYIFDVREATGLPVLRKDFIIDPYQVYAGRAAGADAILLIVAALADSQMAELRHLIETLRMSALVEVHDETELERALKAGASLIGVNNRDLKSFEVDLDTTARIARQVPSDVTLVAESGIRNGADVTRMGQLGAHAVLVGEALVTAPDMAAAVREMVGQRRA